jgi:putative membrane protein
MTLDDLPAVNASLNGLATILLTAGFICIMRRKIAAHQMCMQSAVAVSAVFLASYVTYHVHKNGHPTPFGGQGIIRPIYFTMLISHIILAIVIVPLVLRTLWLARHGRFDRHRSWAKITFPLWYYVSVTGVLVYFFLYQWWPKRG